MADAGQGTGEEGEAGRLEQRLERGAQLGWREACVVPHQWLVLGRDLLGAGGGGSGQPGEGGLGGAGLGGGGLFSCFRDGVSRT